MSVDYITPFNDSAKTAFSTMIDWQVTDAEKRQTEPQYAYSGIVGVSGGICGSVVLRLPEDVANQAAAALLAMDAAEVDEEDVIDAVGELANMIVGCAKSQLAEFGLAITLPNVVTGVGHAIQFGSDIEAVALDFDTEFGAVGVTIGLKQVEAACA